jgi:hypothetical protein
LYAGVKKHWPKDQPLRFVVLTDIPIHTTGIETRPLYYGWKGWWSKMELFIAAQDDLGDILYFDLDTLVVGGLAQIVAVKPLTLLRDFYHLERLQSGLMYLPVGARPEVRAAFMQDPEDAMEGLHGDGDFLDRLYRGKTVLRWQEVLGDDSVVSYKVHVRQHKGQTIPLGARVICFHGNPRPWATPLWDRDL